MDKEQQIALEKYGHFNSTHEIYGVLVEEVQEFFEIVREKPPKDQIDKDFKVLRMQTELDQIRAITERAMKELKEDKVKFV